MKFNLLFAAFLLSVTFSCTPKNTVDRQSETVKKSMAMQPKSHTVNLKKGELFLAVVGNQMPGKETLLQEYFGIVFPPAQKHQFTPLGQLQIDKIAAGDFMANEFVGLFMWPGMENIQAFMGEIDPAQLTKLRMGIWSELKQHMVAIPKDMSITFQEDKVYEVKMVWSKNPLNAEKISKNGGKILLNNPVAAYEDLGKNKAPNNLLIIEWVNQNTADSFRKMSSLNFEKEEAFYTHFAFPEK